MRKPCLALLAALTLPLFTACGDDSDSASPTSTPAPQNNATSTMTTQDKQQLAALGASIGTDGGYASMATGYSEMAKGIAQGFAQGFAPTAGRKAAASCGAFDTTIVESGMTIKMKITKTDGSAFASCEEASTLVPTAGAKITMSMAMAQGGMATNMNFSILFQPNTAGGFHMEMTMSMTMSGSQGGQNFSVSIDPVALIIDQATETADPVMSGTMTVTFNGITISNLAFNDAGIKAGTYAVLKNGTQVAKLVIDANGAGTVYDMDGAQIKG